VTPCYLTSAACAAALRASDVSLPDEPPSVLPGAWELILGTGARGFEDEGGAEPTVRPGWEKGSEVFDSLPQSAPMAGREGDN